MKHFVACRLCQGKTRKNRCVLSVSRENLKITVKVKGLGAIMDKVGDEDVRNAIQSSLAHSGVMKEVKSKLRAEVFRALDDGQLPLPQQPPELALASEIVADFLKSLSYDSSSEVYGEESGHAAQNSVGRAYIAQELGLRLVQDDGQVPLLVLLVDFLMAKKAALKETIVDP
jgi:hypothetical protein